jgi:predicted phosphodiesterase
MAIKIAHISDTHWEHADPNIRDRLVKSLKSEQPEILTLTGDMVNNPWRLKKAKTWLLKLCTDCGIDADKRLLVVPGNHDFRILGNFGLKPISGLFFYLHFRPWTRKRIVHFDDLKLTFFRIDSNPMMFGFARGRVGWRELKRLRVEWDRLGEKMREKIDDSVKILLIHHHPVPIPYEGDDYFLALKDSQRLIQFMAERKIELVLHGHKHRAPYSMISLGSSVTNNRTIEMLGAGAAVCTDNDHDPRGHNFNLVCIEDSGLRYVRQFFAAPNEDFTEHLNPGFPDQSFDLAYQRLLKATGYRYRTLHWSLDIDIEGDRTNHLVYTGLAAETGGKSLNAIQMQPYSVDSGHLSKVWLKPLRNAKDISLKELKYETRRIEFQLELQHTPTEANSADFELQSYDFNATSMNLVEFLRKHPDRKPFQEWEEKRIREPIEDFSWTIRFPPELQFDEPPEFEVLETKTQHRHEWLTKTLRPNFHYSRSLHTASLSIHRPPADYLYRVFWYVPEKKKGLPPNPAKQVVLHRMVKSLLEGAAAVRTNRSAGISGITVEVNVILQIVATFIKKKVEEIVGKPDVVDCNELDVSLMVCDGAAPVPLLKVVGCIGAKANHMWGFDLEVGDGNAGRAFKKSMARSYDRSLPGENRQTYVPHPDFPPHEVLFSMPLVGTPEEDAAAQYDNKELIYGVLNVGTFSADQGVALRVLLNQPGFQWLQQITQAYVLKRLLEVT